MIRLLEILGRAITVDMADLIWQWLDAVQETQSDSRPAQIQQLNKAIELVNSKRADKAEEQIRLYLFENPSCICGRMAAAAMWLSKNQPDKAIKELNSVYMRKPNNTMALYAIGHCYEQLGRENEAIEFYQDCLKFKNYLQLPRQRLAALYFKNEQLEKTTQEYELLKNEYPDDISTLLTLGYLYIANGKYSKAIEVFNTTILIHPDNFHGENESIDHLISQGQFHEALELLENLLEEEPDKSDLMVKRADVLRMLGAQTEAISQYEQAIRICPDYLEAAVKLGTQYLQMGFEKLAAQQFNRGAEINDRIVEAYIGLATAQKLAGNFSDALGVLSLAAAIASNTSLLFTETAILKFKMNLEEKGSDYPSDPASLVEDVIAAHRKQIAHRPQNPDLHYRIGLLMMNVLRFSDAIHCFETVLSINPTHTRARSKLAICLFETEKKDKALKELRDPERLSKESLELHYKTALLYCDKVKFASSLINLDNYMTNNFTTSDATINISIVLQNLGLLDRASATWDNLTDTASQSKNTTQF